MDKKGYQKGIILKNEKVGKDVYKMVLKGDFMGTPGQFFMLKAWAAGDPLLARPLSICDKDEETITFLYLVVGKGTDILSKLHESDEVEILGPLGNGFEMVEGKKVALVAGGIGIAPLLYLARSLNSEVDLYAGFRFDPYFTEEFEQYTENIHIATDDGNTGTKGYVTSIIEDKYDVVYVCGPNSMMKAVQDLKLNATVYLSLEAHMACGIGACLGCGIQTIDGVKRVCFEGPVFESKEVIFDA